MPKYELNDVGELTINNQTTRWRNEYDRNGIPTR